MATRYSHALPRDLRFEPTAKRIRARLDRVSVADTTEAVLVWEPDRTVPVYAIPAGDVDIDRLRADEDLRAHLHTAPLSAAWALVSGGSGHDHEHAAWRYRDEELAGYVVLDWDALDEWYEEEEQVVAHPRDPFHRVDVRRSSRHVRIALGRHVLADSRRPVLVFETGLPVRHYLPRDDVRMELLDPTEKQTGCAYKGIASYFSVAVDGVEAPEVAWTYREPLPDNSALQNLVCFLGEKVDVIVDGDRLSRPETQWS